MFRALFLALVALAMLPQPVASEENRTTFVIGQDGKLPATLGTVLHVTDRNISLSEAEAIAAAGLTELTLRDVTFAEGAAEALLRSKVQVLTIVRSPGLYGALTEIRNGKIKKLSMTDSRSFGFRWNFLNDLPLEELSLSGGGVALRNDDLTLLKLPQLKKLALIDSDVTDRGLSLLVGMCPELIQLTLGRCRINGDGLKYLIALKRLRTLSVYSCPLHEEQLVGLSLCDSVQELYLHRHESHKSDGLGERGLAQVAKMKGLKRLELLLDENQEAIDQFRKRRPEVTVVAHAL